MQEAFFTEIISKNSTGTVLCGISIYNNKKSKWEEETELFESQDSENHLCQGQKRLEEAGIVFLCCF